MASYLDGLSGRDLRTLAAITGGDADQLAEGLQVRPWGIHDILSDEAVFSGVVGRQAHPANVVSPFLLFAVLVHAAANELRTATFVNDWTGPQSRLPVFDVAPLQEFIQAPERMFFLVRLLESFAMPAPAPVPADPFDLNDMAMWVDQASLASPTWWRAISGVADVVGGPTLENGADREGNTITYSYSVSLSFTG